MEPHIERHSDCAFYTPAASTSLRWLWWETSQLGKPAWSAGEKRTLASLRRSCDWQMFSLHCINIEFIQVKGIRLNWFLKMIEQLSRWWQSYWRSLRTSMNEWIFTPLSCEVSEGRVWQELQSNHRGGFWDGAFRGARCSLQLTAVSMWPAQSHSAALLFGSKWANWLVWSSNVWKSYHGIIF